MGSTLGKVTDWSGITNIEGEKRAGEESRRIGEEQAGKQGLALDYLRGQNELPSQLSQGAMSQLSGLYGMGDEQSRADAMSQYQASPIYQAMLDAQAGGEESVLRNAAATGGVRGGQVNQALNQYNVQSQNQALQQYMGGLGGLMQTPTYDRDIYAGMGGIAETEAQAQLAEQAGILSGANQLRNFAQNERQYGHEVGMSFLGGGGSSGGGGGSSGGGGGGMFSDEALKESITKTGTKNGHNTYRWTWNNIGNSLGLFGDSFGVIAQEVEKITPEAISTFNGFKVVNYDMIGVQHGS